MNDAGANSKKEVEMKRNRTAGVWLTAMLVCGALAADDGSVRQTAKAASAAPVDKTNNYTATILVSNEADEAPLQDPLLVNAWGIAAGGAHGPWWVSNNGTGTSTVYT